MSAVEYLLDFLEKELCRLKRKGMQKNEPVALLTCSGTVEQGIESATDLGFPTANIRFEAPDISGTYAGKVLVGKDEYYAAVYANRKRRLLEAHLLDFSGDLYGKPITVILLERLAEAKVFLDPEDQRNFVERAVAEVERYFNRIQ
ncbi:MAG: riboflavin kinase [Patescibacteria group bacterium]